MYPVLLVEILKRKSASVRYERYCLATTAPVTVALRLLLSPKNSILTAPAIEIPGAIIRGLANPPQSSLSPARVIHGLSNRPRRRNGAPRISG